MNFNRIPETNEDVAPYNPKGGLLFKLWQRALAGYLLAILAVTVVRAFVTNLRTPDILRWSVADWLINYEGGFVRRGFLGQITLAASSLTHVSALYLVAMEQCLCYSVLLWAVWRLGRVSTCTPWLTALIYSPAFLSFHVWDPWSGFSKEILFFALSGVLLICLAQTQEIGRVSVLISAAALICVFSHEGLVCYLPYWGAAVLIAFPQQRTRFRVLAAPVLLVTISTPFVLLHHGSAISANRICDAIRNGTHIEDGAICQGSIAALAQTTTDGEQAVRRDLSRYSMVREYLLLAMLSAAPIGWGIREMSRLQGTRRELGIVAAGAAAACLLSIPLFVFAEDWGRWIYIHVVSISFLLLFVNARKWPRLNSLSETQRTVRPSRRIVLGLVLLVYITSWNLPGDPGVPQSYGAFGVARHVVRFMARHYG